MSKAFRGPDPLTIISKGPIYRVTAGLIPGSVWRTSFGTDRAGLIGHKLDPDKLEAKIPRNYSSLDNHLVREPTQYRFQTQAKFRGQSMLEPLFHRGSSTWIFSTPTPSLADISLYNQLNWGIDIASGRGIEDLTAGGTLDTDTEGAIGVFNKDRYPGLHRWFYDFRGFMDSLPSTETVATTAEDVSFVLKELQNLTVEDDGAKMLLPTTNSSHKELDERNGLVPGTRLSVAPDDTGKDE